MTTELEGGLDGKGLKIAIVVARFNQSITEKLLEGTSAALTDHGVPDENVTVAHVPGSFELPLLAKKMAASGRFHTVVCLGAVIRGETDHYGHVAGQAARGIADATLETGVPVIFGVLTTDTMEQAVARSGGEDGRHVREPWQASKSGDAGSSGNTGYSAGMSAIQMADLMRLLDT